MKKYVVGFMFNDGQTQVALVKKNRPEWQAGCANGIGGHIETGEQPVDAMVREFYEETGRETDEEDWDYVCTMYNEGVFECHVFRAYSPTLNGITTKTDEEIIISPLPVMVERISNLDWLIAMCLDTNDKQGSYNVRAVIRF